MFVHGELGIALRHDLRMRIFVPAKVVGGHFGAAHNASALTGHALQQTNALRQ